MGGSTNRINIVIASALAAAFIGRAVSAAPASRAAIRIDVHDYVRLPAEAVARAQLLVTQIYRTIDVDTCWGRTERSEQTHCGDRADSNGDRLFILLLNSEMSERLGVADNVAGVAAVAAPGGGRIAYVLYDRVTVAARDAAVNPMHVLGVVMAHEIAHLLLPPHPHSLTGLMRPRWNAVEFRESTLSSRFWFNEIQANQIRHRLRQGDASLRAMQDERDTTLPGAPEPPEAVEIRP